MASSAVRNVVEAEKKADDIISAAKDRANNIIEKARLEAVSEQNDTVNTAINQCNDLKNKAIKDAQSRIREAEEKARIDADKIIINSHNSEKDAINAVIDILK